VSIIKLCTNVESLKSIWSDISEQNNHSNSTLLDEEFSDYFIDHFVKKLNEFNIEYLYENKFSYWNGGPGKGHYHTEDNTYDDEISLSYNFAVEETRKYTTQIYEEYVS
jgi:hypothetical protein